MVVCTVRYLKVPVQIQVLGVLTVQYRYRYSVPGCKERHLEMRFIFVSHFRLSGTRKFTGLTRKSEGTDGTETYHPGTGAHRAHRCLFAGIFSGASIIFLLFPLYISIYLYFLFLLFFLAHYKHVFFLSSFLLFFIVFYCCLHV